jgi:hypothetical protein
MDSYEELENNTEITKNLRARFFLKKGGNMTILTVMCLRHVYSFTQGFPG